MYIECKNAFHYPEKSVNTMYMSEVLGQSIFEFVHNDHK